MFFDKTAYISTLQLNTPITDQETFVQQGGFIARVNVQPASPELTAISDGEVFKTYKAFTTSSGVIEGMLLTMSGTGEVYRVRGREAFPYGVGQHYELTLAKSDVATP